MPHSAAPNRPLIVRVVEATTELGRSRRVVASLTVGSIVVVGIVHAMTAPAIRPTLLDIVPIVVLTWHADVLAGLLASIACATGAFAIDVIALGGSSSGVTIAGWNALIDFSVFVVVVVVASLKHAFGHQRALARQDPLTGIANRRMFMEAAEREIARSRRYHHPFTVALVDLDGFKQINDTHGHQAGDVVLKRVTELLKAGVRATDLPARLGGDEFALLLPETDYDAADAALEKVRSSISDDALSPRVTASIGAITFDIPPASVDALLTSADTVMYAVKQRPGKNAVMVARASDSMAVVPALVRR
jgi:diguanylate cyclase (GGDEF)-like protein